jgi:hypothetical protein
MTRAGFANAVIVGVEKAGTTSLFRSLSEHPDVAPSSVKETRYFQPLVYGGALEPTDVYASYFEAATTESVRLEATPRYFQGGEVMARAMRDTLGPFRALLVLREPIARFASAFDFQKARLRIPEDTTADEYLDRAEAMTDADFEDPANHAWFAVRGGRYADWFPAWHDVLGDDLLVLSFDDLLADTPSSLRAVASFLEIDPDAYPSYEFAFENQTTAYKRAGFQKIALAVNDRFERFFRRHYGLKEKLRGMYYRLNGAAARRATITPAVRARLEAIYAEPNARLAQQLTSAGIALPRWLATATPQYSSEE